MSKKITITIKASSAGDVESALDQIKAQILGDFTCGMDKNNSASYSYESTGDFDDDDRETMEDKRLRRAENGHPDA